MTHSFPTQPSADLSGDAIRQAQVRSLVDIQSLVPGMKMGENAGYAQITIRGIGNNGFVPTVERSEEHTSELESLMRHSYDAFSLKQNSTTIMAVRYLSLMTY